MLAGFAVLAVQLTACESDNGTQVGTTRFGQVGEIRVTVITPLIVVRGTDLVVEGEIQQVLTWSAQGPWQVFESVSYRGVVGDETTVRSSGNPNTFAGAYASLITQINETQELKLFVEGLDQGLEVDCLADGIESRSRVIFQIRDDARGETARWTRCGEGSLTELTPQGAGPDREAARVIQAAVLARDFALGSSFSSAYLGTLPFGTLDKGEESQAELDGPLIFREGSGPNAFPDPQSEFAAFWRMHSPATGVPAVDWSEQMVLVAAVGEVDEAGDSVEVRRVVQDVLGTTVVESYERVPGDFCSPASVVHRPYHVVMAPKVENVIRFAGVRTERVPCGI